jgi:hypothetical protein
MAPARSSTRRAHIDQNSIPPPPLHDQPTNDNPVQDLFIDPMLGTALAIYIEKDVDDRDILVDLINVRHVASYACNISTWITSFKWYTLCTVFVVAIMSCQQNAHTVFVETWWHGLTRL